MPVGVIGSGEHIVIQLAFGHYLCVPVVVTCRGICKMMSYEDVLVKITHSLVSAGKKLAYLIHILFTAEEAVGLIADLHHADIAACFGYTFQHP